MKIYYKYNDENVTLNVVVDDESYRYRVIKGDNSLTLKFSLPYALQLPLGAWCEFEGERYELKKPTNFLMNHTESYEYTVEMFSDDWNMRKYTVRNMIDKRMKFTITCKPQEHLQLLVDNMNDREGSNKWRVGNYIDGVEKPLSLNFTKCSDYLNMIAEAYETEFESTPYVMSDGGIGHDINLGKIEYNKSNPMSLSYGKGNGLRPGVGRVNVDDGQAIGVLCVQGGSSNIDSSKYNRWNGSGYEACSDLHLPAGQTLRYDGSFFEDEDGFDSTIAYTYTTDDCGLSISCDTDTESTYEDSLDCTSHYPQREEVITSVKIVNSSGAEITPTTDMVSGQDYWVDIIASDIPSSLDYSTCVVSGEIATIIMQSGMLSGKEINIETSDDGDMIGYVHSERRFKLVSQDIDGMIMPNATAYSGGYMPKVGDTFKVFQISLPTAYYGDNTTKTGAEWDMFRESVKYLAERLCSRYNYTCVVDGLWSKDDWINKGGKLCLGGYIKFSHEEYEPNGVRIRIVGIKDYINNPHCPEIELSNAAVGAGSGIGSVLNKIPSNEVKAESEVSSLKRYTKRAFRDAKETAKLLVEAGLSNFTESISPITINTMQAIVGDESLQFYFVARATSTIQVEHLEYYDSATKQFKCDAGVMQHKTLGITTLSSAHTADEYKSWNVEQYTSAVLTDTDKPYYLYIKASTTETTAVFLLSETKIAMTETDGYYHFLTGILNSEAGGTRSYAPMYGMTLLEPGRMVVDQIQSANFDLQAFEGMLIDLIGKRIIIGGDAQMIVRSLTLSPPDSDPIDAYTSIDSTIKDISYINDDAYFSINEKLDTRIEWRKISGRSDVDHTPSEAGSTGSYMIAVTTAEAAGIDTTALTAAYQALLNLFSVDGWDYDVVILEDGDIIVTEEGVVVLETVHADGLALYVDENTAFTRSDLSDALSAYSNAESAILNKTTETTAVKKAMVRIEGDLYVDETVEAKVIKAERIAAKSITAEKIAAESITAEKIAANAITAEKIDVDSLVVGKVKNKSIEITASNFNNYFQYNGSNYEFRITADSEYFHYIISYIPTNYSYVSFPFYDESLIGMQISVFNATSSNLQVAGMATTDSPLAQFTTFLSQGQLLELSGVKAVGGFSDLKNRWMVTNAYTYIG